MLFCCAMWWSHDFFLNVFSCTGCGLAWALDGNWKLTFPVCMFPVHVCQPGMKGLHVPNVCPEEPTGNTIFCKEHRLLAEQRGYPCHVKEFLQYCGASQAAV